MKIERQFVKKKVKYRTISTVCSHLCVENKTEGKIKRMKHNFVCIENIIEGLDVNSGCLWEKGIGIWGRRDISFWLWTLLYTLLIFKS